MEGNKMKRGFTLIELLVVIAIIGILSAIVLASLNSARSKAQDSKVQSQLANMRAAAEIYYGSNGNSYGTASDCSTGLFADTVSGMASLASSTPSIVCNSVSDAWAAEAPLPSTSGQYWCVDSTGRSKQVGTALSTSTVCPTS